MATIPDPNKQAGVPPAPDPVVQKPVPSILAPAPAPATGIAPAPATGGGLITNAMKKPNIYNPDNIQAATAGVSNWTVGDDQLVEKRAANIAKEDSPLMQLARSRAEQQANGRGLLNSSLAVGAGQTAVLDKAVDIGSRDATTLANSAQFNANASNQASMFNAGQSNQWNSNKLDKDWMGRENVLDRDFRKDERIAGQDFTAGESEKDRGWKSGEAETDRNWRTGEAEADRTWKSGETREDRAFQNEQKDKDRTLTTTENQKNRDAEVDRYKFDAETQKKLKELSRDYQKELDSDQAFNQQYSQYMDSLKQIDMNPDLDENAKMVMKNQARAGFENFAKIKGMKLDLDFGGGSGGGSSSGGGLSRNAKIKKYAEEHDDPTKEENFIAGADPLNLFGGMSASSKNQSDSERIRTSITDPLNIFGGFHF